MGQQTALFFVTVDQRQGHHRYDGGQHVAGQLLVPPQACGSTYGSAPMQYIDIYMWAAGADGYAG